MVLNLHGECPSDHEKNITILNAESKFLETLEGLHSMFPKVCSIPDSQLNSTKGNASYGPSRSFTPLLFHYSLVGFDRLDQCVAFQLSLVLWHVKPRAALFHSKSAAFTPSNWVKLVLQ